MWCACCGQQEKAQAQAFAEVLAGIQKFAIKKKSGDNDRIFGR
jgi:ribosomal protein L9